MFHASRNFRRDKAEAGAREEPEQETLGVQGRQGGRQEAHQDRGDQVSLNRLNNLQISITLL